jgi:hypothetical protein
VSLLWTLITAAPLMRLRLRCQPAIRGGIIGGTSSFAKAFGEGTKLKAPSELLGVFVQSLRILYIPRTSRRLRHERFLKPRGKATAAYRCFMRLSRCSHICSI